MKPFQARAAAIATALFLLSAPGTAAAAVQLDQFNVPETGFFGAIFGAGFGSPIEQSFTVGLDGHLDSVDVGLMELFTGSGGVRFDLIDAGGGVLASVQKPAADLPDSYFHYDALPKFDLTYAGISVASGDLLRFRLTPYGDSTTAINFIGQSAYGGGSLSTGGLNFPASDLAFRTYVDVSAVPEPGVWALMIVGFGLAGGALRLGRRSAAGALAAG